MFRNICPPPLYSLPIYLKLSKQVEAAKTTPEKFPVLSFTFWNADSFNSELVWDTSQVTNMGAMFAYADVFNSELVWDTSAVTVMAGTFDGAIFFNQPLAWDTSKVVSIYMMFNQATSFNRPLAWDTSKVTNFGRPPWSFFGQCAALTPSNPNCV